MALYVIFCILEMVFAVVEMCYLVRTKTALFYLQNPDSNAKVTQLKKSKQEWTENMEKERKAMYAGIDGDEHKGIPLEESEVKKGRTGQFAGIAGGLNIKGPSLSHSIRFDDMKNVSMDETEHLKTRS